MMKKIIKKLSYIVLIACVLTATTTYALSKPMPGTNRLENEKSGSNKIASSSRPVDGRLSSNTDKERGDGSEATSTQRQTRDDIIKIRTDQIQKVGIRLQATADRLQGIVNRLLSRIEKIKNAGGKTADAEKYMLTAETSLDNVKQQLTTLSTMLGNDMALATTTKKKIVMDPAKKLVQDIQKNLTDVQKTLGRAVGYLMSTQPKVKPEASSTPETNKNN